jgi:hypothetical protein
MLTLDRRLWIFQFRQVKRQELLASGEIKLFTGIFLYRFLIRYV